MEPKIYSILRYEHLRKKSDKTPNPIILKFNPEGRLIKSEIPKQTYHPQLQPVDPHVDLIQYCLSLPPVVGEEEYLSQITDHPELMEGTNDGKPSSFESDLNDMLRF